MYQSRWRVPGGYREHSIPTVISTGSIADPGTSVQSLGGFAFCQGGSLIPIAHSGGFLRTSKAFNKYGDKECVHVKFSGFLFPRINTNVTPGSSYKYLDHEITLSLDMRNYDGTRLPWPQLPSSDGATIKSPRCGYTTSRSSWPQYIIGMLPVDLLSNTRISRRTIHIGAQNPIRGWDWSYHMVRQDGRAYAEYELLDYAQRDLDLATYLESDGTGLIRITRQYCYIHSLKNGNAKGVRESSVYDDEYVLRYNVEGKSLEVEHLQDGNLLWTTSMTQDKLTSAAFATEPVSESAISEYLTTIKDTLVETDFDNLISDHKSKLIRDAIDNCRALDINTTAYLRDVRRIWSAIKPIFEVISRPLNPESWANLWLTYRYGIRLFLKDSYKILQSWESDRLATVPRFYKGRSRLKASAEVLGFDTVLDCHLTIKGSDQPKSLDGFFRILRQADLLVTLNEAWDLLPYSFVLDWLLPIQDTLKDLDRNLDLYLYDIQDFIWSVKATTVIVPPDSLNVTGSIEFSYYKRWREEPDHSLSVNPYPLGEGINVLHSADLLALCIQRKPK